MVRQLYLKRKKYSKLCLGITFKYSIDNIKLFDCKICYKGDLWFSV